MQLSQKACVMGLEEEGLLDSEMTYKDNTIRKTKAGTPKNTVGVLMFVFVVCALSAMVGCMVGVSLYHCLAQQHLMGLVGETEKDTDDQLVKVLNLLRLDDYLSTFEKHGLDYEGFLDLNDDDFREMNIPIGPRKKIAKKVQELRKQPLSKKN